MINIGDYKKIKDRKMVYDNTKKRMIPDIRPEYNFATNNETQIQDSNFLLDVMRNMDEDKIENDNLTSIDFNTRLSSSEISTLSALQLLYSLKVGGNGLGLITRIIKRNKVSLNGLGRIEKVKMVQGDREHEENKTGNNNLFGKFRGFLNGKDKTNQQG